MAKLRHQMTDNVQMLGNTALMERPKMAFLSSRKVAPAAVMRCYDWATGMRGGGSAGRLAPPDGGGTPSTTGLCEMRWWRAGGAAKMAAFHAVARERDPPEGWRARGRPWGLWRGREGGFLDSADFTRIHLCEAKALAADILQRSADEIEFPVVDDEETVMEQLVVADGEFRVLLAECQGIGIGYLVVGYMLPVVMLRGEDRHPNLRCQFGISSYPIPRQTT